MIVRPTRDYHRVPDPPDVEAVLDALEVVVTRDTLRRTRRRFWRKLFDLATSLGGLAGAVYFASVGDAWATLALALMAGRHPRRRDKLPVATARRRR